MNKIWKQQDYHNSYNIKYLNLPEEIKFNDNARRMKNIYNAAGNKPAKILEADDNGKVPLVKETRHYLGNFVYKTDTAGEITLQ